MVLSSSSAAVITPETLTALDLLVWMRTDRAAAERLNSHPSTLSQQALQAARCLSLRFKRVSGEWQMHGPQERLQMERELHQRHRLLGGAPLRLECTAWDAQVLALPAPPGWITGVFDHMGRTRPLQLLQERVIDAWISNCLPDLPGLDDPEFCVIQLSRFPVWLLADSRHPLARAKALRPGDLDRFPCLALPAGELPAFQKALADQKLWTMPVFTSRYHPNDWEGRTANQVMVCLGNCMAQRLNPTLVPLDWDLGLQGGQALVVRRDLIDQARILQLLDLLQSRTATLTSMHPALEMA